ERHRSKEFIEFLSEADEYYRSDWKIRIILDNHSIHLSQETRGWLKEKPHRFEFVYTPKPGSWLNLIEVNASPVVFTWTYKLDEITV
ncbi:MAG: transposase, partial [Candidatus Atribacteria bacterium]|nr:transposase [Candidatus Atribacteria bacterium]